MFGSTQVQLPVRFSPARRRSVGRRCRSPEAGQALPLVLALLAVCLVAMVVVAAWARVAVDRARAQAAADSSALAGALDGPTGAAEAARRNGATLVSVAISGSLTTVEVRRGRVPATAVAQRDLVPVTGGIRGVLRETGAGVPRLVLRAGRASDDPPDQRRSDRW